MKRLITTAFVLFASFAVAGEWRSLPQIDGGTREDPSTIDHLLPVGGGAIYIPPPDGRELVVAFQFSSTFASPTGWKIFKSKKGRGGYQLRVEIGKSATNPKAKPHSYEIPLDPMSVQTVREIWTNVIRDARFGPEFLAPDATGFNFQVIDPEYGLLEGSTTAIFRNKPPGLMVEAGYAVLEFAESPTRDEKALGAELLGIEMKLIDFYKKR